MREKESVLGCGTHRALEKNSRITDGKCQTGCLCGHDELQIAIQERQIQSAHREVGPHIGLLSDDRDSSCSLLFVSDVTGTIDPSAQPSYGSTEHFPRTR